MARGVPCNHCGAPTPDKPVYRNGIAYCTLACRDQHREMLRKVSASLARPFASAPLADGHGPTHAQS